MKIRFATSQDKEQILKLMDEFNVLLKSQDVPSKIGGAMFDEIIKSGDNKIFVAEENNKLIGTATLYFLPNIRHGEKMGYVKNFYVTERMRDKGVGRAIFGAIKKYCLENNVKVIKLTSSNKLKNAHNFYEAMGGKSTERSFRFDIE
ncbi:MAG: GNAT family N-acetyltransferase [Candidatus Pacebacteria bacterium]|nr:GNAT family N-acetyltransferase [Candidatus Paceibacterota bacterium]